ncbi:salicylate synthase [Actinomadura barringtoniae]|uniref:Salicylate synthase n=1 Tax=Actinomadura barringtoniae TaxID=1427535 RepID=A0A939PE80_9ACTN|nr:salicylate synthase [Actinomadura barringtoniae]MBO2450703.1 salicylate synthase [Actinomadura barringtoniae]
MPENRTELVVENAADPLLLLARLAGSGLFDDYVAYERPDAWTFAGGTLGEVILDSDTIRAQWPDAAATTQPWTGRPADALRAAFADAPLPAWNAYGWVAFEFAAARPTGRLAHLIVPRTEVSIRSGRAHITGIDPAEVEQVAKLLAKTDSPEPGEPTPVDVRTGDAPYKARVAQAVAEITAGDYQKVIVSRRLDITFPVDVISTYVQGRRANTPARSFLLDLAGFQATGFSPEVLASVENNTVHTQPLAGTRSFGHGDEADAATRHELETDPKEIFEHAVSVRTSQDELNAVCDPGSVRVTGFMTVKERGSVQHLGSSVMGTLSEDRSAWDALAVLFPGVTASGIPKPEAIEAIARLEERRGLYAGAVVTLSHTGTLDSALVLRALYNQDGQAWLRAGAGIVSGSTPEREYEETCEKLSSIAPHVVPLA